ncbi:MAG: hypothetical protein RIE77_13935 [Phycisphaerales bacterium]|jgi:hypothetical protein
MSQGVVATDRVGGDAVRLLVERSGERFRLTTVADAGERPQVGLAPWGQSLVRCRGVDDLPPQELLSVLAILGDGELPERVPAWRRACGALPVGNEGRTALLTAWMPGGEADDEAGDARFATAPAALGLAVSLAEGCAFASDSAQGVLIVAARGPEGVLVRSLRESPDVVSTDAHVERRLLEAASAVGLHEDQARSTLRASAEPGRGRRAGWSAGIGEALAQKIEGWPSDAREAAKRLLPACAGMLALSDDPAVRALASLRQDEPATKASTGERMNAWLASRRNVAVACAVCVLVVLFTPLLGALVREAMLGAMVARAETLREQYEADARRAAIYGQLNERVWPMTKMLAEVSAAAPVHVVLESVRMDSNAQIDIEGFVQVTAGGPVLEGPPESLLTRYETALNELGTLGSVTVVRREVVGDAAEFQISARVRSAIARASLPQDFAEMSLAEVLYGEGASNTTTPVVASASTPTGRSRPSSGSSSRGEAERASRDSAIESSRESAADRRPSGESGPASEDGVPTPITDAQIAELDRSELLNQWRIRNSASRDESNDAGTRARLKEEADKLIARYREVGSGG